MLETRIKNQELSYFTGSPRVKKQFSNASLIPENVSSPSTGLLEDSLSGAMLNKK
jgi:hypothetical protein